MSMLYFLTIAVILSFLSTYAESEKALCVNDWKNCGEDEDPRLTVEETKAENGWEQAATTTATIKVIGPTHNLPELLSSLRSNSKNRIWIVFSYRESCERSIKLLRRLSHQAIPELNLNGNLKRADINFVPMPIDDNGIGFDLKEKILNRLGIFRLPSLFFLCEEQQEKGNPLRLENIFTTAEVYRGLSESPSDLVNGLHHYLARMQSRQLSPLKKHRGIPLTAIRVKTLQELSNIIRNNNETNILQNPVLPLDPDLSEDDDMWIRYLMDDDSFTHSSNSSNDFYVDVHDGTIDQDSHDGKSRNNKGSCKSCQPMMRDSFYVVAQCRNMMWKDKIEDNYKDAWTTNSQTQLSPSKHQIVQLYQEYDKAVKVLGVRRNVIFSTLEPSSENRNSSEVSRFCDFVSDDGHVKAWDVHSNESLVQIRLDEKNEDGYSDQLLISSVDILEKLSSWFRPEVMWFDRRMTAPIAFHPRYNRHAILFVDFHDRTSASKTRDAIRIFRQECRRLEKKQPLNIHDIEPVPKQTEIKMVDGGNSKNSFVCLVVPSTDVRVLNTFGIDIWSHLDHQAAEKIRSTLCHSHNWNENHAPWDLSCDGTSKYNQGNDSKFSSVLPTLLVTDRRRDDSIQRFYLDPPITQKSLTEFFNGIIHGRTKREEKSSYASHHTESNRHKVPTSKHMIHLLTAESLPSFLKVNQEKHVLIELYAPTCGHCKRFNVIWNSLGRLIKFLGWSDQLLLARIDATTNEIFVPGMAATWLPGLFYFGVGVYENPIHYENTPLADDAELGSISDPLDLLEWWMDEAGDTINEAEILLALDQVNSAI